MTTPELRVGVSSVEASAIAQIDGDKTRGTLPWPRMTTAQRTAITGTNGLTVYDTDLQALFIWESGAWAVVSSSSGGVANGFTTTVTAAGTTTLTNASTPVQEFTGATTQDCVLPNATTLIVGWTFVIRNASTGAVTVKTNGGATLVTLAANQEVTLYCKTIGTAAGTWSQEAVTGAGTRLLASALTTLASGTSSIPSLAYGTSPSTGFYSPAAGSIALTAAGQERFSINASGLVVLGVPIGGIEAPVTIYNATDSRLRLAGDGSNAPISGAIDFTESYGGSFALANATGFRIIYDGSANNFRIQSANSSALTDALAIARDTRLVTIGNVALGGGTVNATTVGITTPAAGAFTALSATVTDAATNTPTNVLTVGHVGGTVAAGFGTGLLLTGEDSTTADTSMARLRALYSVVTHASYATRSVLSGFDSTGERDVIGWGANGSAALLGFYPTKAAAPIAQPTALTTQLTTITHTAPGTPDYAVQDLTQTTPFGFVTKDEGNTVLSVIANLQTRVGELETKLQALGLLA